MRSLRLEYVLLFAGISALAYCQESETLSPFHSFDMHEDLKESSGLIYRDGDLWTHNDSRDNTLFRIDPANGEITDRILLAGVVNTDWEDIAQDSDYIYIGDIGNNSGSRKDLHILRIARSSLNKARPEIETISFSFEDQDNFIPRSLATDFDCEAMIVHRGQIFLFTKEWINAGSSVYKLPAIPGHHVARKVSHKQIEGLITGADISADGNTIILCGYTSVMYPFIYILKDPLEKGFEADDLFGGTRRRINLSLPSHQVEGIAIKSADEIFISNEYLKLGSWIEIPQQIHILLSTEF